MIQHHNKNRHEELSKAHKELQNQRIDEGKTEETDCNDTSIPEIVRESAGCDVGNTDQFQPVIVKILNGIIGICGLIAVVYIVIGGINYMTSSGDAGKIKKARDTILYAVIGLIVVALAFALVNFVIVKVIYN